MKYFIKINDMKYYITTDTHLGHLDKMVEYCGRPYDYEQKIHMSLSTIKEGNVLIHLGDVCIGNDSLHNRVITNHPGIRHILVRGNHDNKSDNWYYEHGWDFVCDTFSLKKYGKNIIFSHQPQPIGDFDLNIHGHFHNALPRLLKGDWKADGEKERNEQDLLNLTTDKHKLLSLEETDYQPVELHKFINS